MRVKCERCGRTMKADMADLHAENSHYVDPVEIDFSPIGGVSKNGE